MSENDQKQDQEQEMDRETAARAVNEILRTHNLQVNEEEYEELIKNYPRIRRSMAKLRIPEARYAEPALIFTALPH